jgi:hypothetical protein
MDAHQIFWNWHNDLSRPTTGLDKTTGKLAQLIELMHTDTKKSKGETKGETKGESKESKEETKEYNDELTDTELSDPDTEYVEPTRHAILAEKPDAILAETIKCDSLFINRPWNRHQVDNIAKCTCTRVEMNWVKAVASKVVGASTTGYLLLHDSERHVHHVGGGVANFLQLFSVQNNDNITTFSWTQNSTHAIHIQQLQLAMCQLSNAPMLLLMIACSVGLPTTRMFSSTEFLEQWKRYRFHNLTEDTIIKTILRDHFSVVRIGVESKQLVDEYIQNIQLFSIDSSDTLSVDTFFMEQWYSYPSEEEIKHLLRRTRTLKNILLKSVTSV